jgi:hypothetical protein
VHFKCNWNVGLLTCSWNVFVHLECTAIYVHSLCNTVHLCAQFVCFESDMLVIFLCTWNVQQFMCTVCVL